MVEQQTKQHDVFPEGTMNRKLHYCDFSTRRCMNQPRIFETANHGATNTSRHHTVQSTQI